MVMKIGLIARCDSTGLGIQSKGFYDHIPCKAFVIDFSNMAPYQPMPILAPHPEWYPGETIYKWGYHHNLRGDIPRDVIEDFVKDIDVLFAIETPYDYNIFEICRQCGVKTILQLNYEFLDFPSSLPQPDLFAAPSMWNYDNVPEPKKFLPVPVDALKFRIQPMHKTFIHIAGRAAAEDRNGTYAFLRSLNCVKNEIEIIIKSQEPIAISKSMIPGNVKLTTDFGNKDWYWENYTGGVLVLPRKYGGLSLPVNEALASGMPVIITDISPNNTWLPKDWLVHAALSRQLYGKKVIDVYEPDLVGIAEKIDQFCDENFYMEAVSKAMQLSHSIRWENLVSEYMKTMHELCQK